MCGTNPQLRRLYSIALRAPALPPLEPLENVGAIFPAFFCCFSILGVGSVGLADYSQVDILGVWYKSVNFRDTGVDVRAVVGHGVRVRGRHLDRAAGLVKLTDLYHEPRMTT